LVTLLRIYPKGIDANVQFDRELKDPAFRDELIKHNLFTHAIGDKLFEWFRSGKKINGHCTPYLSFSTGFRATEYNREMEDSEAVIYAIKIFPMNVNITAEVMSHVLECIQEASNDVMKSNNINIFFNAKNEHLQIKK
jgi:L-2,4-diaminobutyrate decarboxylase